MITKRCQCPDRDRCPHLWHIWAKTSRGQAGTPERGPVTNYLHLLPAGAQIPVTRNEAKRLEKLVLAWMIQGKPAPRPTAAVVEGDHPVTINDARRAYQADYVEAQMSYPEREISILNHLCNWRRASGVTLGECSISALTDHKLARAYLAAVEARSTDANMNRHLSRWSHFLNWCRHEFTLTGESPFYHRTARPAGVERTREGDGRHRRLTDDEDAALIATFKTWDDGGMMLGRYYCALDTLLRQGEMLNLERKFLKVEKVHGATVYALEVSAKTAKSGIARTVEVATDRLTEWLESRRSRLGFPFGQLDGAKFTASMFRSDWENCRVKAGLYTRVRERSATGRSNCVDTPVGDELHWHDLRHEGASLLLEHGTNIDHIRRILGHTSLKTTQRYLNPKEHGIRDAMRKVAVALGR